MVRVVSLPSLNAPGHGIVTVNNTDSTVVVICVYCVVCSV